jgi:hypothetical protein
MNLLLTKFHMYLENIILQVINTNTWKISPKGAFLRQFVQRNNKDAHQLNSTGAKHHGGVTHIQPTTHHVKVVARWRGQGVADP